MVNIFEVVKLNIHCGIKPFSWLRLVQYEAEFRIPAHTECVTMTKVENDTVENKVTGKYSASRLPGSQITILKLYLIYISVNNHGNLGEYQYADRQPDCFSEKIESVTIHPVPGGKY